MIGVGGDDSWRAKALKKYTIFPQKYYYKVILRSVINKNALMKKS